MRRICIQYLQMSATETSCFKCKLLKNCWLFLILDFHGTTVGHIPFYTGCAEQIDKCRFLLSCVSPLFFSWSFSITKTESNKKFKSVDETCLELSLEQEMKEVCPIGAKCSHDNTLRWNFLFTLQRFALLSCCISRK